METKLTNSQIPTHSLTPQLVRQSLREFIAYIGDDPDREGLIETPDRILRSWSELFWGYQEEPERFFKLFTQEAENDDLVVISGIEYFSMCEHHAIPFFGEMHIGYVPDGHILGLSKFARLVNVFARRLQTEEHLVSQIADTLMQYLTPQGVIVISCAKHLCACGRGVKQRNMKIGKSALRGNFKQDDALKQEFFELIKIHLNMR